MPHPRGRGLVLAHNRGLWRRSWAYSFSALYPITSGVVHAHAHLDPRRHARGELSNCSHPNSNSSPHAWAAHIHFHTCHIHIHSRAYYLRHGGATVAHARSTDSHAHPSSHPHTVAHRRSRCVHGHRYSY